MKIAQSSVSLESSRSYLRQGTKGSFNNADLFSGIVNNSLKGKKDEYVSSDENEGITNNYGNENGQSLKDRFFSGRYALSGVSKADDTTDIAEEFSMQYDLFYVLFRRLFYAGAFGALSGSAAFSPSYNSVFEQRVVTYEEHESTEFHAKGTALTEDGRSIDFSVDISMSRSYMEYMDVSIPISVNSLLDPLIINVGSGITEISDQKFKFDLNADGTEEEISMLGKNSGFLSLDLNDDGVINDGSELFGTKSGDGFADLAVYDSDKNGWIDENDDIFDKLKVWFKDEDGKDILMNLKEADIGAIYLGEAATEFTLGGAGFRQDGVIRSTGFFLKESTGIGTVQHVDLAIGNEDDGENEASGENISSPAGEIIMINNPSRSIDTGNNTTEKTDKKRIAQNRELEKKARLERIEERRQRQKQYEEKRMEELYERKERLEEELKESELNRLFMDRMYEVV